MIQILRIGRVSMKVCKARKGYSKGRKEKRKKRKRKRLGAQKERTQSKITNGI